MRVRAPARDVSSHTRVFFATWTCQFTIHFITKKTRPNTRQTKHRTLVDISHRSCCTKRDVMLIPVCRATDTMPRRTTLLHAIPSRTDSRSARPHIRDASRARVPDVTQPGVSSERRTACAHACGAGIGAGRSDGHERVIHNVRSFGWLHRRSTAPLSANHAKHTRHIKQRE